jgi:hypothetical protein
VAINIKAILFLVVVMRTGCCMGGEGPKAGAIADTSGTQEADNEVASYRDDYDRLYNACLEKIEAHSMIYQAQRAAAEALPSGNEKISETEKLQPRECYLARMERNRIIGKLMNAIDVHYITQRARLVTGEGGIRAPRGVVTQALAASATKNLLAALTGVLVSGENPPDEKSALKDTDPAIVLQMEAFRAARHAEIDAMKDRDVFVYSLNAGIKDVYEYYRAGTIIGASLAIADQAEKERQDSANKLREIIKAPTRK